MTIDLKVLKLTISEMLVVILMMKLSEENSFKTIYSVIYRWWGRSALKPYILYQYICDQFETIYSVLIYRPVMGSSALLLTRLHQYISNFALHNKHKHKLLFLDEIAVVALDWDLSFVWWLIINVLLKRESKVGQKLIDYN